MTGRPDVDTLVAGINALAAQARELGDLRELFDSMADDYEAAEADRDRAQALTYKQEQALHRLARRVTQLERERDEARRQVDQRETWFAQSRERVAELEQALAERPTLEEAIQNVNHWKDKEYAARERVAELEAARDEASTLLMVGHGLYPEGSDQNTVGQPINVGSMGWVDAAVRILRKLAGDGGGA